MTGNGKREREERPLSHPCGPGKGWGLAMLARPRAARGCVSRGRGKPRPRLCPGRRAAIGGEG